MRMPVLHAEFMYQAVPMSGRAGDVFSMALNARLGALREGDTALFLCNAAAAWDSLSASAAALAARGIRVESQIVNPQPRPTGADTPTECGWTAPDSWQPVEMSDRWARLLTALHFASALPADGYLVLPSHEAVYDEALLAALMSLSQRYSAADGRHYAVSPRNPFAVDDAVPPRIAHILAVYDAAFDRAPLAETAEGVQGFWGKMAIIPLGMCAALSAAVNTDAWEDDLEIDTALRQLGHGAIGQDVSSARYRQVNPFETMHQVERAIERHLHYSLKIPGPRQSILHAPPSAHSRQRAAASPAYAAALAEADVLIRLCEMEMRARVARFGCSWVDWGAYRYVARPGDPAVEVWKRPAAI